METPIKPTFVTDAVVAAFTLPTLLAVLVNQSQTASPSSGEGSSSSQFARGNLQTLDDRGEGAAEAAAQQDRSDDLYHELFEIQAEWGEAQEVCVNLFRRFAEEGGPDMAAYTAVSDRFATERVSSDFEEGRALSESSIRTFLVDGALVELQEPDDRENVIQFAANGGQ